MKSKAVILVMIPMLLWGMESPFLTSAEQDCWRQAMSLYKEARKQDEEMGEALYLVMRDGAGEYGNVCRALELGRRFLKEEEERRRRSKELAIASVAVFAGTVFLAGMYRRLFTLYPPPLSDRDSPG